MRPPGTFVSPLDPSPITAGHIRSRCLVGPLGQAEGKRIVHTASFRETFTVC
jgi:hypothetical protein